MLVGVLGCFEFVAVRASGMCFVCSCVLCVVLVFVCFVYLLFCVCAMSFACVCVCVRFVIERVSMK